MEKIQVNCTSTGNFTTWLPFTNPLSTLFANPNVRY
jgi:hypothetical protein